MAITKKQLNKIIQEELDKVLEYRTDMELGRPGGKIQRKLGSKPLERWSPEAIEQYKNPPTLTTDQLLDRLQWGLFAVGLIPGIGNAADIANSLLSLYRKEYFEAILFAVAALPFGAAATAPAMVTYRAAVKTMPKGKAIGVGLKTLRESLRKILGPSWHKQLMEESRELSRAAVRKTLTEALKKGTSKEVIKQIHLYWYKWDFWWQALVLALALAAPESIVARIEALGAEAMAAEPPEGHLEEVLGIGDLDAIDWGALK